MPFQYDDLFYNTIIKRIYSNIYADTIIFNENDYPDDYPTIDEGDSNIADLFYLKQIDFYSLNGTFEKSITINNNARYFSVHVSNTECRNQKCYQKYDLNGLSWNDEDNSNSNKMSFHSTFNDGDDIGENSFAGIKITLYTIDKNLNISKEQTTY